MIPRGAEQTRLVKKIFTDIAGRYDLINRLISMGMDRWWRQVAARWATALEPKVSRNGRYLDVATGTGDLALALSRARPGAEVIGLDLNREMLVVGATKVGPAGAVRLVQGDAFHLPFDDGTFDGVTICFGVRNLPDHLAGLKEMARVVRPGGRVCVLETHWPRSPLFRGIYDLYFRRLMPWVGRLLTGDAVSYKYLADSTLDFPPPEFFVTVMKRAGLDRVIYRPLTLGTVALYVGIKPDKKIL